MTEISRERWSSMETATLAGGCFWCLEAVFQHMQGVQSVTSGYMGGHIPNPTYEAVCTGTTGYAEVVQIVFDPSVVSYRDLLDVFFAIHDPTTLNRQGPDVGSQYRSAIFYHSPEQKRVAEDVIADLTRTHTFDSPIVTELTPAGTFYVAEDYHQNYYARSPSQPYCTYMIAPKIAKFRKQFAQKAKHG